jgi:hypothetical protein
MLSRQSIKYWGESVAPGESYKVTVMQASALSSDNISAQSPKSQPLSGGLAHSDVPSHYLSSSVAAPNVKIIDLTAEVVTRKAHSIAKVEIAICVCSQVVRKREARSKGSRKHENGGRKGGKGRRNSVSLRDTRIR